MSDVNKQRRLILVAQILQRFKIRRVRIHREQTLGHHEDAVCRVLLADSSQMAANGIDIEVPMQVHVGRCRVGALLQARVSESVHHNVIRRPNQSLDHPVTGGPTGWIEYRVIDVEEFGDCFFQSQGVFGVSRQGR